MFENKPAEYEDGGCPSFGLFSFDGGGGGGSRGGSLGAWWVKCRTEAVLSIAEEYFSRVRVNNSCLHVGIDRMKVFWPRVDELVVAVVVAEEEEE